MSLFSNNKAHLTGAGNFNLGIEADDGAGDASFGYSKGDIWWPVPLNTVGLITNTGTFARTSQGIYTLTLNAASGLLVAYLTGPLRKFAGTPAASAPHGLKVVDLTFAYTIATANETSISVAFSTELQTNNGVRSATTSPFGTVTYANPPGTTVANPPTATQANPYVVQAIPPTPIFVNTDTTMVTAEVNITNPGTSVFVLTMMTWHLSVALY